MMGHSCVTSPAIGNPSVVSIYISTNSFQIPTVFGTEDATIRTRNYKLLESNHHECLIHFKQLKNKTTSYLSKTGFMSQFASWKRNLSQYLLKKFVGSELIVWWFDPRSSLQVSYVHCDEIELCQCNGTKKFLGHFEFLGSISHGQNL